MLLSPRQEAAVMSRVRVLDNGCWEWTGPLDSSGYATAAITIDGVRKTRSVHTVLYRHKVGPIPDGLELDHVCHTLALQAGRCASGRCPHRRCVNPAHLEPVTPEENARRRKDTLTHCPQGHEYTPDNSRYDGRGYRVCVSCSREQERASRERTLGRPLEIPHGERTRCPQGHPYDDANTYTNPQGRRNCRACTRAAGAAYRARKRRESTGGADPALRPAVPAGR